MKARPIVAATSILLALLACNDTPTDPETLPPNRFRAEVEGAQNGVMEGTTTARFALLEQRRVALVTLTGRLPEGELRRFDFFFPTDLPSEGTYPAIEDWQVHHGPPVEGVGATFSYQEGTTIVVTHVAEQGEVRVDEAQDEIAGEFHLSLHPGRPDVEGEFTFVGSFRVDR